MQKFELFVYGDLKRNFPKHESFCKNAASVEAASVNGVLYNSGHGFPVLCVAPGSILAVGHRDYCAGAALQARVSRKIAQFDLNGNVYGELIAFANPDFDVMPIDNLEGQPHYSRRVLIPAKTSLGRVLAAWAYIMPRPPFGAVVIEAGTWNV